MSDTIEPAYLSALDPSQKDAVLAKTNCIVTAGAGAGKTSVLVARCLHLVLGRKLPLRSILALTFTRKAAAEMYERIYAELAKDDSPWAMEQLADFQNSHITTLDSFCSELTRSSALDWGYTKDFTVDEEKAGDLARTIARAYVARNKRKPGLAEMLKSFPFEQVASDLFGELGSSMVSPLRLQAPIFGPMGGILENFADDEALKRGKTLAGLSEDILAAGAEIPAPRADCAAAMAASRYFFDHLDGTSLSFHRLKEFSADLAGFIALGLRAYSKLAGEGAVKELAREARTLAEQIQEIADYIDLYPSYLEMLKRLDEYALELAEAKRLADLMDYKDLGRCAVYALKKNKDLRSYWKRRVRSILIDEFQDNNALQKELLFFLAEMKDRSADVVPKPDDLEEGKLFLVGDEKQSIYKFRGADVSVFKTLAAELESGSAPGSAAQRSLSSNYRSSPSLIEFFNKLFTYVMNTDAGLEKPAFSASYSSMTTGKPGEEFSRATSIRYFKLQNENDEVADQAGEAGEETEFLVDEGDSETLEPDEALAFSIARFIGESKGFLETRKGKAEYGDFAVLFKTTTNQRKLEKHLRLHGIPFESDSPRGLFCESPANDIYALISLLLDPSDRAAYAAILRGPFCRLSDSSFVTLMTENSPPFEHEGATPLSELDAQALAEAAAYFAELRVKARSTTVAELVDFIWHEGGLRFATLARPSSHSFLEHFDYLFRLAADTDATGGGLSAFRALLRPYIEGSAEKLEVENVPKLAAGGVKLLTIHKAKGLQFPIVIVPWVENTLNSKRDGSLWCPLASPHGAGLAIDSKPFDAPGAKAVNVFLNLAKDEEKAKSEAELKRLLYVASTRAQDHLFFFGKTPYREGTRDSSFRGLLEGFIASGGNLEMVELPLVQREQLDKLRKISALPSLDLFAAAYAAIPALIERWPRSSFTTTELSNLAEQTKLGGEGAAESAQEAASEVHIPINAKLFGTLCHLAVEYSAEKNSTEGFSPPPTLLRGIEAGKASLATAQALELAKGFLESPLWLDLSGKGRPEFEKPFLLAVSGALVDGRMDLFLETSEDITILDFKSDLTIDPERYSVQLDIYSQAAQGICKGKMVRSGIFWLRTRETTWLETKDPSYLGKLVEQAIRNLGAEYEA